VAGYSTLFVAPSSGKGQSLETREWLDKEERVYATPYD
jgi:hypothetical protein